MHAIEMCECIALYYTRYYSIDILCAFVLGVYMCITLNKHKALCKQIVLVYDAQCAQYDL